MLAHFSHSVERVDDFAKARCCALAHKTLSKLSSGCLAILHSS